MAACTHPWCFLSSAPFPPSSVSLQLGIQARAHRHPDDNSHPFDLEQFRLIVVVTDFWFGGWNLGSCLC